MLVTLVRKPAHKLPAANSTVTIAHHCGASPLHLLRAWINPHARSNLIRPLGWDLWRKLDYRDPGCPLIDYRGRAASFMFSLDSIRICLKYFEPVSGRTTSTLNLYFILLDVILVKMMRIVCKYGIYMLYFFPVTLSNEAMNFTSAYFSLIWLVSLFQC